MRVVLILLASLLGCFGADSRLRLHFDFEGNWLGSGTVTDRTAFAHNGLNFHPTNMVQPTNGVFGSQGGAWRTNDSVFEPPSLWIPISQYLGITNITDDIEYLTNGTICWWFWWDWRKKNDGFILDGGYPVNSPAGQAASNSWSIWSDNTDALKLIVYDSTSVASRQVGTWPNMQTNGYHFYALTFSCTGNTCTFYYDGTNYLTTNIGTAYLKIYGGGGVKWLAVGRQAHNMPPGVYEYFGAFAAGFVAGSLDEIRIYNAALTQTDITDLFNGQEPTPPAEPTFTKSMIVGPATISGNTRLE